MINIVITGATSGLGRAIFTAMNDGTNRFALCGRSEEKLKLLEQMVGNNECIVFSKAFCNSDIDAISRFSFEAIDKLGNIDLLVNCAGLNANKASVSDIAMEDLDFMYKVNFRAPLVFTQTVLANMKVFGKGTIFNIHTTCCLYSNPGIGAYTATKAGFDSLTKILRKELVGTGINVVNVYPGGINTEFREKPNERYMEPEKLANYLVELLNFPPNIIPHEIVIRPECETNFV